MADGTIRLPEISAGGVPTPPSGKGFIFVDNADSLLKFKDDTGNVTNLAGISGVTADTGGTTTGSPITLAGALGISTTRSGDTITIAASGVLQAKYALPATASNVGANSTIVGSFGDSTAAGPVTMAYAGDVVAISISSNNARTAGTCTARVTKNGVAQTGVSQVVVLDGTNTLTNYQIISPVIAFVAGDTIGVETNTVAFAPTGADTTVTIWVVEI
jgi:hypothetical protein